jgi:hypothetical protein
MASRNAKSWHLYAQATNRTCNPCGERFVAAQAPGKPKTPYGEMLQYYLKMEPQLFKAAVEDQLLKIKADKDAQQQQEEVPADNTSTELSLSKYVLARRTWLAISKAIRVHASRRAGASC